MKINNLFSIILSVILLIITTNLFAQDIPLLINYQGNLTDAAGQKINKPDMGMTFSIWSDKTSTDISKKLWEEVHYPVAIIDGLFSVVLGEKPLSPDIFSSPNRYLEVTIGTETLSPRQQIGSVPYAYSTIYPKIQGGNHFFAGLFSQAPEQTKSQMISLNGFSKPPTVLSFLVYFDAAIGNSLPAMRIQTLTENVTKDNFILKAKTWADSEIYGVVVGWIAFGN